MKVQGCVCQCKEVEVASSRGFAGLCDSCLGFGLAWPWGLGARVLCGLAWPLRKDDTHKSRSVTIFFLARLSNIIVHIGSPGFPMSVEQGVQEV